MQRRFLDGFAGCFKTGDTHLPALQFMALAALRFERLSGGDAGRLATSFSAGPPLDEVQTFGQRIPVVVALSVAGNGIQLPVAVDFDLLNDVDVRHRIHLVWLIMGSH